MVCLAPEASFGEIRLNGFPLDVGFSYVVVENSAMRAKFANEEANHGGRAEASKFQQFVAPIGMFYTRRNINDLLEAKRPRNTHASNPSGFYPSASSSVHHYSQSR